MTYVSNHDVNAWEATEFDAFGDGLKAAVVLAFIGEGLPLIYNGQEAGNEKRLAFFEKDPIEWRDHEMGDFYRRLIALRKSYTALRNGEAGARMLRVYNSDDKDVFSFIRENDADKVFVVLNFSDEASTVTFSDAPFEGRYVEYLTQRDTPIDRQTALRLEPWGQRIFVRRKDATGN